VELKAVRKLSVAHEVQLVNYLAATNISVGLLINFGEDKVEVKRKVLKL
jgi:GxxExxY protein